MSTNLATGQRRPSPGDGDARRKLLARIPVSERRLELADVSTALLEGGEGPDMVLLHGPAAYGASWHPALRALVTTHHVIAPDLPGHGASAMVEGHLDGARVTAWLGELIEQTCATPPVLVGQLVGGAIAAHFAADDGERLERLVLVTPLGLAPFQPSPAFGAALMAFLSNPGEETHDELWAHCVLDLGALRGEPGARWELLKAYTLDVLRTTRVAEAMNELMEEFAARPIPEATLARIAVPTTLIWGRQDSIVPLSVAEAASARYGWPLQVVENAGNEPALEAPDAFLHALLSDRTKEQSGSSR
jgi:pimeloyl-ACP methyl ester carboxylesterase